MQEPSAFEVMNNRRWGTSIFMMLAAVLLAWMTLQSLLPDFHINGRGAFLNTFPPWLVTAFFAAIALVCAAVGVLYFMRALKPSVHLRIDDRGVSGYSLRGMKTIAWGDIGRIEQKNDLLFLWHARPTGRVPAVALDFASLQASRDEILGRIAARRPDLFG